MRSKVHLDRRAAAQGGRLHHQQLTKLGLSRGSIRSLLRRRVLIPVRPKVYALGYVRTDLVARIWEALLYAGPGAYLTGASGAHHCELIAYPPGSVIVATPHQRTSLPGILVLQRRSEVREFHHGIPVAPIPELMLELAASSDFNLVRKALANLDYRRQLDVAALLAACSRGRRGSAQLRGALERHLPQLAYANGDLEVAFLLLLEANHLTLPRVNVRIHGILVDAFWPELKLVIELDGKGNHGTSAQQRRDASDAETLRSQGITVLRLNWHDVHTRSAATVVGLASAGVQRV